ncbi:helix-turn-helix domain-containing protein [Cryptosporangium aurantiacum]|uniref:AraC-type DNA-binding protein n=1 Tax=Cryptosporangium aurantiacum TaxID=134849 RepID=A0A1M7RM12_9ACTN|nr:helix-turn-helix domain-containing protein [Cryptosporangium aurantiacum]SHN47365.1 AraC-type DNA-binding protein [Cryptosporangium aurantiacum]
MELVSTAKIPAKERFDFWRQVTTQSWVPMDSRCDRRQEDDFQARIGVTELGAVRAVLMTATPYSVRRTPQHIRRFDPETFKLSCPVRGRGMMEQNGRDGEFKAGDLFFLDTSQPYATGLAPDIAVGELLTLQFSPSLLPFPHRELRRLTAVHLPVSRGIGALSSVFLLQLARHLGDLSASDAARLSTLALDVLTVALANALDVHRAVPTHTRRSALLAQIHAFINQHLGEARLSPRDIAAAHHISVRYLHKVFQDEGHTVAGVVRARRLERCRRDLADPLLADRPISAIAARWGFSSAAHFSQTFRSAYGLSPREFRHESDPARELTSPVNVRKTTFQPFGR